MDTTTNSLWWTTPFLSFATLGGAMSLGASVILSLAVMPVLQNAAVPVQQAAMQTSALLYQSDRLLVMLDTACQIGCIFSTIVIRWNSAKYQVLIEMTKLYWSMLASISGFVLAMHNSRVMSPMKMRWKGLADDLRRDPDNGSVAKEFRQLQERWQTQDHLRAVIKTCATLAALGALLTNSTWEIDL